MTSPGKLITDIATDAVLMNSVCDGRLNKRYGPGQYLLQRVSEEDRDILRGLTADDIQNYRPELLILSARQEDCKACRLRFDQYGHQRCTFNKDCIFWDKWRDPLPNQRTRSSVYCLSQK